MNREDMALLDTDKDGIISDKDLEQSNKIVELEEKIKKAEAQEKMAWLSLIGILFITSILFSPLIPLDRLTAIGEFIGMFYITLGGVIATYMGSQAWTLKK